MEIMLAVAVTLFLGLVIFVICCLPKAPTKSITLADLMDEPAETEEVTKRQPISLPAEDQPTVNPTPPESTKPKLPSKNGKPLWTKWWIPKVFVGNFPILRKSIRPELNGILRKAKD